MASTDNAAKLHGPLCVSLIRRYLSYNRGKSPWSMLRNMVKLGIIDSGRLYEIVKSLETGIPLNSVDGRDLEDDSNCKLSGSYGPVNGQKTSFGWRFKVENCAGDARLIFRHPKEKRIYEAHIPKREISGIRYLTICDTSSTSRFGKWTRFVKEVGV